MKHTYLSWWSVSIVVACWGDLVSAISESPLPGIYLLGNKLSCHWTAYSIPWASSNANSLASVGQLTLNRLLYRQLTDLIGTQGVGKSSGGGERKLNSEHQFCEQSSHNYSSVSWQDHHSNHTYCTFNHTNPFILKQLFFCEMAV